MHEREILRLGITNRLVLARERAGTPEKFAPMDREKKEDEEEKAKSINLWLYIDYYTIVRPGFFKKAMSKWSLCHTGVCFWWYNEKGRERET